METSQQLLQAPAQKCPWHEDVERRIVANENSVESIEKSLLDYRTEQTSILESLKIDLATIKERVCNGDKITWQFYVMLLGILVMIIMNVLEKVLK